ncbi:hypothetical protein H4R35_006043 [Dimargaris xerosporica]|nr:hypothetical protein H4R35_006043 [Dimargaris xerosporica]
MDGKVQRYRIFRSSTLSRDRTILNDNNDVEYTKTSEALGFNKKLVETATGEVLWAHDGRQLCSENRSYISETFGLGLTLSRTHGCHMPWYQFNWDNEAYMWKSQGFGSFGFDCYRVHDNYRVAMYHSTYLKQVLGTLTLYLMPGSSPGLKELLIFSIIDLVEVRVAKARLHGPIGLL